MLVYKIEPIFMRENMPLEEAFNIIFSPETLHRVHGDNISASPFINDKRTLQYKISILSMPTLLKPYLWEPYVNSTMEQKLERHKSYWNLYTSIQFHFPLGNLIAVTCKFIVFKKHGKTYFGGYIKHEISMPLIRDIGEHYLMQHSKREVEMFEKTIRDSQPKNLP